METDEDLNAAGSELAQLLVLEAGRILEDLTPEMALRLLSSAKERRLALEQHNQCLSDALTLLTAAQVMNKPG